MLKTMHVTHVKQCTNPLILRGIFSLFRRSIHIQMSFHQVQFNMLLELKNYEIIQIKYACLSVTPTKMTPDLSPACSICCAINGSVDCATRSTDSADRQITRNIWPHTLFSGDSSNQGKQDLALTGLFSARGLAFV